MTQDKEQGWTIRDLSNTVEDETHVKMKRWFYYTDRAKLLFVKGYFPGEGELEKAFDSLERPGDNCDFSHFEIVCKPEELVRFAKQILDFYSSENIH